MTSSRDETGVARSASKATSGPASGTDPEAASGATDAAPATGVGPASALGYEQARDELVDVVRQLEVGGTTLEESLALWERGEELAKVCRHWLDGARRRLDAALAEEAGAADEEDPEYARDSGRA
jgi:exodeoxyribonuclease VII small subunit